MEATQPAALAPDLREAVHMAANWYVRLQNVAQTEAVTKQWADWLKASPLHQQAWQQVQAVQHQCQQVPGQIAASILQSPDHSRRRLLRNLAGIALLAPTAWVAYRAIPLGEWQADYRTAVGERRNLTLADGSQLSVNTHSAVDVRYTVEQRLLYLHEGEILIQTAKDNAAEPRPFRVNTRHGTVQALGTRFTVRVTADATRVTVLQDTVRIHPTNAPIGDSIVLHGGEQLVFNGGSAHEIMPHDSLADSWVDGSLIVVDMPLETLLNELSRYRSGVLSCDPAIAELKISGAFPLDDTELALKVLTDAFPLQQSRLTRYWVRISSAS